MNSFSYSSSSAISLLYSFPISSLSHKFLLWFTKKLIIVFGTESQMFFFTRLKYDTIKSFIISISVCSRFVGFSLIRIVDGTCGSDRFGSF